MILGFQNLATLFVLNAWHLIPSTIVALAILDLESLKDNLILALFVLYAAFMKERMFCQVCGEVWL